MLAQCQESIIIQLIKSKRIVITDSKGLEAYKCCDNHKKSRKCILNSLSSSVHHYISAAFYNINLTVVIILKRK